MIIRNTPQSGSSKHLACARINPNQESAFTIVELMAVVIIMAIIGFIAVPQFGVMRESFDRVNARSYVLQDLKRAQAETITQGCRGIVMVAAGGGSYSYGCDYLSYDPAASPSYDSASFVRYMPGSTTISASGPIIFNSRGQSVDVDDILNNVSLTLTDSGGSDFATGTLQGTGVFSVN